MHVWHSLFLSFSVEYLSLFFCGCSSTRTFFRKHPSSERLSDTCFIKRLDLQTALRELICDHSPRRDLFTVSSWYRVHLGARASRSLANVTVLNSNRLAQRSDVLTLNGRIGRWRFAPLLRERRENYANSSLIRLIHRHSLFLSLSCAGTARPDSEY